MIMKVVLVLVILFWKLNKIN